MSLGRIYAESEINFSKIRGRDGVNCGQELTKWTLFSSSWPYILGIEKIEMLTWMNGDMALNQECHLILKGKNKYYSTSQPYLFVDSIQ